MLQPAEHHRKFANVAPHILMWGFLFVFPLLFNDGNLVYRRLLIRNWLPLFFSAVLFYANYLYLVDRLLVRRKIIPFLLVNTLLVVVAVIFYEQLRDWMIQEMAGRNRMLYRNFARGLWFRNTSSFLFAIVMGVAVKITGRWYEEENKRKKTENEHLRSELTYLHYQLQPHFFFNTLNNIYVLVEKSPDMARDSILRLSKLMRYLLYEASVEHISLGREIDFLQSYISLMELRVPRHVSVQLNVPATIPPVKVAPLLFVSLVENAFKHGVHATLPGFIHISVSLNENTLVFRVDNSNFPKRKEDKSGSGIGLVNLHKRLDILYPGRHVLSYESHEERYHAQLTLSLKENENTLSDRRR